MAVIAHSVYETGKIMATVEELIHGRWIFSVQYQGDMIIFIYQ